MNLFGKPSAEVVGGGDGEGELQECAGQLNGECFSVYFFGDGCRRRGGSFVAAVAAARAAYIAGFDASSNLEAHRTFGVPSMGTSAHSFTLLYDSEESAFRAQLDSMGTQTTLLVDTYDIENAVRSAV